MEEYILTTEGPVDIIGKDRWVLTDRDRYTGVFINGGYKPVVGDIIRRRQGVDEQEIYRVDYIPHLDEHMIWARYTKTNTDHYPNGQRLKDIVFIREGEGIKTEKEETKMTDTLYQVIEEGDHKDKFGVYLATNSSGKWLLEEKGTGATLLVSKDGVEEVLPYTVDIRFMGEPGSSYSYTYEKGKLDKNDLVLIEGNYGPVIVSVVDVDTKSRKATKELKVVAKVMLDRDV